MQDHIDDVALVVALRSGEPEALAGIYDRYSEQLYNFAFGLLRNPDDAADVVHDAFLLAQQRIDQLRDATKLRAWMFAIVRNGAMRRSKQRSRAVASEDVVDMTVDTPNLGRNLEASELQQLVWAAADGLDERDRQLLELTLKQQIEGDELADIMGVKTATVYVLVNRMKERVERSLGALLVARLGREECDDLQEVLADWDGTFSVLWRKRVARHVDDCEVCQRTRAGVASPAALLSAMPFVAVPAGLRDRVLGSAAAGVQADQGDIAFTASHGFPELASGAAKRGVLWLFGAAAAIVALVVGGYFLLSGADDDVVESVGVEIGEAAVLLATSTTAEVAPTTSAVAVAAATEAAPTTVADVLAPTNEEGNGGGDGPSGAPGDPGPADDGGLDTPSIITPAAPPTTSPLGVAGEATTTLPQVTTSSTSSTTVAVTTTTQPPPTTTTASPAALTLDGTSYDLGTGRAATMRISNTGGRSTSWSASADAAVVSFSPASGALGPGESVVVTISVDRSNLPEQIHGSKIDVAGDGTSVGASVAWVVANPPEIVRASVNGTLAFTRLARSGAPCTLPTTLPVTATVTDETSVTTVLAQWVHTASGASGTASLRVSAGASPDTWTGTIGPFDAAGDYTVTVTATDPFGASASRAAPPFVVSAC